MEVHKRLISNRDIRYIYAGRMSTSAKNVFVRMFFRFVRHSMAVKRCAEISFQNVGAGFHVSHGTAIIVTAKAKIGENCSLRNGITIICKMDAENNLTEVVETKDIVKTADGAEADGKVIDVNSLVSMNMWGLTPDFLDVLEEGFKEFFEKEVPGNPLKAEYLIPIFIGELLEQGKMSVKVLKTNDTWYGMTYHEDVAAVKDSFKKMLEKGVYKADLFADL